MGSFGKVFTIVVRLLLGGIFLYASLDKIVHPSAFAKDVYNYQILPDLLVNAAAITLPWVEVLIGLGLISTVFYPGALTLAAVLLVTFYGALVFNAVRGLDIHCGCFSTSASGAGGGSVALYLMRDGIFLLMAFFLLFRFVSTHRRTSTVKESRENVP